MATRSSTRSSMPMRFTRGSLVSVLADCFDDKENGDDESERWSSKFQNGRNTELFGVVDKVYATRCDVYFFYDKVTTKIDVENLTLKSNQELVILEDGSEWKREGFCRLIPLDGDKSEKLSIGKDTTQNPTDSTFDFHESAPPIRIGNLLRNKDCKRKATDPDIMTIKIAKIPRHDAADERLDEDIPENFEMIWPADASDTPKTAISSSSSRDAKTRIEPHTGNEPSSSSSQASTSNISSPQAKHPTSNKSTTVARTRIKKLPIYKRPVKNLAEAEVASNYDDTSQENMPERTVVSTIKLGTSKTAPKRTLTYSTKRNTQTRRSKCDMIVGKPGPTTEAKQLLEPLQAFDYYFTPELQRKVVSFVNKKIVSTLKTQKARGIVDVICRDILIFLIRI